MVEETQEPYTSYPVETDDTNYNEVASFLRQSKMTEIAPKTGGDPHDAKSDNSSVKAETVGTEDIQ